MTTGPKPNESIELERRFRNKLKAKAVEAMNIEDFEIFLEDFTDMLNGLEASIVKMKQQIAKLVGVEKGVAEPKRLWLWNPDKIKWEKAQGSKGEYERSEDVDNPEFKAMLKDLNFHGGKLTRDGYFLWVYRNGSTVGRKKVKS